MNGKVVQDPPIGHKPEPLPGREELIKRFRPLVLRAVAEAAPEPDERRDLEQAGYLGLLVAADRFDASRRIPFAAYGSKLVRGYVKKEKASNRRFKQRHLELADNDRSNAESPHIPQGDLFEVHRFIADLPRELKHIVKRRYWDQAPDHVIAAELGVSRRTLVNRLQAIRIHGQARLAHLRERDNAA